jgi:hypothetical protein
LLTLARDEYILWEQGHPFLHQAWICRRDGTVVRTVTREELHAVLGRLRSHGEPSKIGLPVTTHYAATVYSIRDVAVAALPSGEKMSACPEEKGHDDEQREEAVGGEKDAVGGVAPGVGRARDDARRREGQPMSWTCEGCGGSHDEYFWHCTAPAARGGLATCCHCKTLNSFPVRHLIERPGHRNHGEYQFVKGYTGGGAEECVHLSAEQVAQRCRDKVGAGRLIDDGLDLWWEQSAGANPPADSGVQGRESEGRK